MHLKTRTWFLISVLCFILAGYFWHLGIERDRRDAASRATNRGAAETAIKELGANNFHHAPPPLPPTPASPSTLNSQVPTSATNATNVTRSNPLLTNRLSNTSKPLKE